MGDKSLERTESAFSVFKNSKRKINIIDQPEIINGIAMIPFTSSEEQFINDCKHLHSLGADKLVICHQTFNGAKYESGMYAPDGFDHTKVPQEKILSGHIHIKQEFDKVEYIGTWRWMTKSDANDEKGYCIMTNNSDGSIKNMKFVSTENICKPIYELLINEGEDLPEMKKDAKYYITLKGSKKWANTFKKKIKNNAIVSVSSTDKKVKRINLDTVKNIEDFINAHFSIEREVTKEEVVEYIKTV